MNKNSTQKGTRNFETKVLNFITILPSLPAPVRRAGNFVFELPDTLNRIKSFVRSIISSAFSFINCLPVFSGGHPEFIPVAYTYNSCTTDMRIKTIHSLTGTSKTINNF